jgi:hypothetical protein
MNPRILPLTPASTSWLRLDRLMLLGRYDCGALPLAVFNIVKRLETELAWREHARAHRSAQKHGPTDRVSGQSPNAHSKENAMGERKDYAYGSQKYVRAEELAGKTVTVTIENVEDVQFDDTGAKPVLHFKGKKKGLVVTATKFDVLAAAISPRTENWVGHTITLKGEKVWFKTQLVDSIIVSVPTKPKQQPAKEVSPDDIDDGIPDDFAA